MPLREWKWKGKRRNEELVDRVRDLSDIVDVLKAEVEAIKICTNIDSKSSPDERRNRVVECGGGGGSLDKFKRCLRKHFIPLFSRDKKTWYDHRCIPNKCHPMFSQTPTTIIPPPTNLPANEKHQTDYQHFSSPSNGKSGGQSEKCKISSNAQYSNHARGKKYSKDSMNGKKSTESTSQHRGNVTFVDREKNIPLDSGSSVDSRSAHFKYNVIRAKPKIHVNSVSNEAQMKNKRKKISRSAQCSLDRRYLDELPKDLCVGKRDYTFTGENKSIAKNGRKALASKSTQTTSKSNKYTTMGRKRYCCSGAGSESSFIYFSPRSIGSSYDDDDDYVGSREVGEGSMYRYYKREGQKEKKINNKLKRKIRKNKINTKPRGVDRKRDYPISRDVPKWNFHEEQKNSSSDEISTFHDNEQRKNRRKWKKYDRLRNKVNDGHELGDKQRASSCQVQMRDKKLGESMKLRENTSSSSHICSSSTTTTTTTTTETCDLIGCQKLANS